MPSDRRSALPVIPPPLHRTAVSSPHACDPAHRPRRTHATSHDDPIPSPSESLQLCHRVMSRVSLSPSPSVSSFLSLALTLPLVPSALAVPSILITPVHSLSHPLFLSICSCYRLPFTVYDRRAGREGTSTQITKNRDETTTKCFTVFGFGLWFSVGSNR